METSNISQIYKITDKSSDTSNSDKRSINKPKKSVRYKQERELLILELEKLMGLNENNRHVLLYDLEKNDKLNKYLISQIPNIKQYFKCGSWNYFVCQNGQPNQISLLKSIFKDNEYEVASRRKQTRNIDGEHRQQTMLFFLKDANLKKYFAV
jgi:hypothetical protein